MRYKIVQFFERTPIKRLRLKRLKIRHAKKYIKKIGYIKSRTTRFLSFIFLNKFCIFYVIFNCKLIQPHG